MSGQPPAITAIVIFRNERALLEQCLSALNWCDQLIAIDMESTDGSRAVAARFTQHIYRVPVHPIAEPTRVAAARLASNDWILLIDPDEIIPPSLVPRIRKTLAENPDAGALRLPTRYYFKKKMLTGTVWGTLIHKRQLIHRDRCALLAYCNRITELKQGEHDVCVPAAAEEHVRHYWSDSYQDLLHKHLRRYPHMEAKALVASGERFSLRRGFSRPARELKKSLKDFDGWRMGPRGFLLSGIYLAYVAASSWLVLWYQRRAWHAGPKAEPLPVLERVTVKEAPRTLAA